jgi:hypothetical protein
MRDTRDFAIGNVRIDGNLRRRWSVDGNYGARDGGDIRNVDVIGDVSGIRNVDVPRDAGNFGHVGNVRLRVEQHCGVFDTNINVADNARRRGSNRTPLGIDRDRQPWSQLRGSCADAKRIADHRVCSIGTNHARGDVSAHGFDDSDKPVPLSDFGGRRLVEHDRRLLRSLLHLRELDRP